MLDRRREPSRAITSRGKTRPCASGRETLGMPKQAPPPRLPASCSAALRTHRIAVSIADTRAPAVAPTPCSSTALWYAPERVALLWSPCAATNTARNHGRLLVHGQLAPHKPFTVKKKSALHRQRLAPELAPRVDAARRRALVRPVARGGIMYHSNRSKTTKFTDQ